MLFVFTAWVPFRAESFAAAAAMLGAMAGANGVWAPVEGIEDLWLIAVAAVIAVLGPTSQRAVLELLVPRRLVAVGVAVALVFVTLAVGGGDNAEFIYFQF